MRVPIAMLILGAAGWSAPALAQGPGGPTTPPPTSAGAGAAANAGATSARPASPPAPAASTDVAAQPGATGEHPGAIPTADQTPATSDHDAIVGHVGIEARSFDPGPLPLTLQPGVSCPAGAAGMPACEVTMGAIGVRYWWTRNLALNGGVAFAVGGGRTAMQSLDTHVGLGPTAGLTLLL